MWLSFAPLKRGFAVSVHHPRAAQSLAAKYAEKFEARFAKLDSTTNELNALQTRLPVRQRRIRFSDDVGELEIERFSSMSCLSDHSDQHPECRPSLDKYTADQVDDFLTDAAPLGLGIESSDLFLCKSKDGKVFMTTELRAVEKNAAEAGQGGTLASTTLYSSDTTPRNMASGDRDQAWTVAIDDRTFFYCVDDVDRGLRNLLQVAGVRGDDLTKHGILFNRIQ